MTTLNKLTFVLDATHEGSDNYVVNLWDSDDPLAQPAATANAETIDKAIAVLFASVNIVFPPVYEVTVTRHFTYRVQASSEADAIDAIFDGNNVDPIHDEVGSVEVVEVGL